MSENLPPRKGVTAWDAEVGYDDDPLFVIVTLHHGLGEMTRFDLDAQDARELASLLVSIADNADQMNALPPAEEMES